MKKKLLKITILAAAIFVAYNNCGRKDDPGTIVDKVLQSTQTGNPNNVGFSFPKIVCAAMTACGAPAPSNCVQQLSQNEPFYQAFQVQGLNGVHNFIQLEAAVQQNLVTIHLPKAEDCADEIEQNICHNEFVWEAGNYDQLAFLIPERSICQGVYTSIGLPEGPGISSEVPNPNARDPYGSK